MTKLPPQMICVSIDMERTGKNIEQKIKERGYSIQEIMAITGVSTPQAVYKWYSGKSIPTIETLIVLSEVLEVGITDLLVINSDRDIKQSVE